MIIQPLNLTRLDIPHLIDAALTLPQSGSLSMSPDGLIYLDIHDDYIHTLFPLLNQSYPTSIKPDYFGEKSAGAHISVIYPEENTLVKQQKLGKTHRFKILDAFSADLGIKRYYVLTVAANSLIELRSQQNLGRQLKFKGHWIDLHITIGTSML